LHLDFRDLRRPLALTVTEGRADGDRPWSAAFGL
jgi:hypothetical protein